MHAVSGSRPQSRSQVENIMQPQVIERFFVALAAILGFGIALLAGVAEARGKPPPPPPPPTPLDPPGRAWHGFVSNGAAGSELSRLYLYGGSDTQTKALADLWYYSFPSAVDIVGSWTLVTPAGRSKPGPRQWHGWSCGGGGCLLAYGSNGVGLAADAWYYTEAPTSSWAQVRCRRAPCPSAREMVTTAYDASGHHLLFGGRGSLSGYSDTWLFDPTTKTWQLQSRQADWPQERNRAAAAFVPGVGVVMLGGQDSKLNVLCDMYAWKDSDWTAIGAATGTAPCLHSHSMAWDAAGQRLVVTGGYTDTSDTENSMRYYLPFSNGVAGAWSTDSDLSGCVASVHAGARMAFDVPTRRNVFFGGERNIAGSVVRYGDTTICQ